MLRSSVEIVSIGDVRQVIFSKNDRGDGVVVKGLQKIGFLNAKAYRESEHYITNSRQWPQSNEEWLVKILEITNPEEKKGIIRILPIEKCQSEEQWQISNSEHSINGISLPQITKKVTVGERIVESESFNYSISYMSHINTEWPEEIKSELKNRVELYEAVRKKAVEAIQWPTHAPTQEKVDYDDGTLVGTMTCRLCFFYTVGVGLEVTFTSPQLGSSWEYKRISLSPLTKITTHEEWEEIAKVLGEPREIKQFDYLHPERGIMLCWGKKHAGAGYEVEMQMLLECILPSAEIELSTTKEQYREVSFHLLIAWQNILTELTSGLILKLESLSEPLCSLNKEQNLIVNCEIREDRVPQIIHPHFNIQATSFSPEIIRNELVAKFVQHMTTRSWNTMWKQYILHGQEERSKEPRSKIYRLLGEVKTLLSSEEVESFYKEEKTTTYEGYSPDGMRGGTYSTSYVDVHYYGYGGYSRRWGIPLLQGSTQQEIKTAILEEVLSELEEIGKTYQIWLTTPLEYAPEKENCLYISGEPEDIEGLDQLEKEVEKEASELLENISQSIQNSRQFIAECGATSENIAHLKRRAKRFSNLIQIKSFPLGNAEEYRKEALIYAKIAEKGETFQLARAVEKLKEIHSYTIKNLKEVERNNLPATQEEAENALKKCESILDELRDAYQVQFIWNEFYNLRALIHDMKFHYNNSGNFVRILEISSSFLTQAEPLLEKWQKKVQTDRIREELIKKEFSSCPLCNQELRINHYCTKLFQKGGLEKDFDIKVAKSEALEIVALAATLDQEYMQHYLYVWTSDKELELQSLEEIAIETVWTINDVSSDTNVLLTTGDSKNSLFASAFAKAEKKKKK